MALYFQKATGSYIDRPSDDTELDLTSTYTICAWIYLTILPSVATTVYTVLMKGTTGVNMAYHARVGVTDVIELRISATGIGSTITCSGATALSLNTWYHVSYTFDDPNNTMLVYLNGLQDGSQTVTTATFDSPAALRIGANGAGTQEFTGYMEDVRIYNRVLTANEILCIANGRGHDGIYNGLAGKWEMDESGPGVILPASSAAIKDSTPNNLKMTGQGTIRPRWVEGQAAFRKNNLGG